MSVVLGVGGPGGCAKFIRHEISLVGGSVAELTNMKTWTDHLGHSRLRSFTDDEGHFWLEQNAAKKSKWGKLARDGHEVAWEFGGQGGAYTGRMLIDGEIYTPSEATKKFLQGGAVDSDGE